MEHREVLQTTCACLMILSMASSLQECRDGVLSMELSSSPGMAHYVPFTNKTSPALSVSFHSD